MGQFLKFQIISEYKIRKSIIKLYHLLMNSNNNSLKQPRIKKLQSDRESEFTYSSTRKRRIERSRSKDNEQSLSFSKQLKRNLSRTSNFKINDFINNQCQRKKGNCIQSPKKQRKRQPTPCKSRTLISFNCERMQRDQIDQVERIENKFQILGLKKQLQALKKDETTIKTEIQILKKQNKTLHADLVRLENDLRIEKQQNAEASKTITFLQKNILQAESNLQFANRNFQKLQKQIKANQVSNLKTLISKLEHENNEKDQQISQLKQAAKRQAVQNENLRDKLKTVSNINKSTHQREHYLQQEINQLKRQLQMNKSSLIIQLQQKIKNMMQHQQILLDRNQQLLIELDFKNRKSAQEYKLLTKKKNQLISSLKKKNDKFRQQIQILKTEINKNKQQKHITCSDSRLSNNKNKSKHQVRDIRESIMKIDHKRNNGLKDDQICLELSPE